MKCFFALVIPMEFNLLLDSHGFGYFGEVWNELVIISCQSKETTNLVD
jgi:hypothetical protein